MRSYDYPEAGKALSDVMTANGVAVCLPEQAQCRGTPLFASGDFAGADMLAAANVRACQGGFDAGITGCATCGTALAHEYGTCRATTPRACGANLYHAPGPWNDRARPGAVRAGFTAGQVRQSAPPALWIVG